MSDSSGNTTGRNATSGDVEEMTVRQFTKTSRWKIGNLVIFRKWCYTVGKQPGVTQMPPMGNVCGDGSHLFWWIGLSWNKDEYGRSSFHPTFPWTIWVTWQTQPKHWRISHPFSYSASHLFLWTYLLTHPPICDIEHFLETLFHHMVCWASGTCCSSSE